MKRRPVRACVFSFLAVVAVTASIQAANLHGGNGVYRVLISDGQTANKCGVWTALTGELHAAGPDLELLTSVNGTPLNSSYTTLRSHQTDRNLTTSFNCIPLCIVVGPPAIEAIMRDGTTVGHRLTWIFEDKIPTSDQSGPRIEFSQEVVVDGPIDGTETVANSIVRETHTVKNHGPGGFRFGLRKLWDLQVDTDEGPWFGDCATPLAGCDRSVSLTRDGAIDGPYPRTLIFRSNPTTAACPGNVEPDAIDGCAGDEPWIVAATVSIPTGLNPRPYPPQMVQYGWWSPMAGACWTSEDVDAAECGTGGFFDDTALAYFYGVDRATAIKLRVGQSRSFTQYLALDTETCPPIVTADSP